MIKPIGLDQKNVNAYVNKGVALGKLEKYEEAIACYDKAIGLDQKNASAYFKQKLCIFAYETEKRGTKKPCKGNRTG
jgi:tetratricopeptide (TPR) repeat protein